MTRFFNQKIVYNEGKLKYTMGIIKLYTVKVLKI